MIYIRWSEDTWCSSEVYLMPFWMNGPGSLNSTFVSDMPITVFISEFTTDFTQKCMHFLRFKIQKWKMNSKSFSWTICIYTFKSHPLVKILPHWSQWNLFVSWTAVICVIFATLITFVFSESFMDIFNMHFLKLYFPWCY